MPFQKIATLLFLMSLHQGLAASPPAPIDTPQGQVQGVASRVEGVTAYLGLPYAEPPVGSLRWKAPRPAARWEGVRRADAFGNRCIQTDPFPDMIWNSPAESEDCLYLSAWAPEGARGLPVMVWIHGGGFLSGSGDEARHDGAVLASRNVVVVTINYRLGVLGFLAHPELTAESKNKSSGNYAVLDMVAALRWVRDNIADYGGNPDNVTIFGESAGSFAVSTLMASPLAQGLFHRAIGQSGAQISNGQNKTRSLADAEALGARIAKGAGADSLPELRATEPPALAAAAKQLRAEFNPVVDGHVLTESPDAAFRAGRQHDVPLVAGWTSAETKWIQQSLPEFLAAREHLLSGHEHEAARLYPAATDAEARRMAITLVSDTWIVYPTWKWAELHRETGRSPVFRYVFDQVMATPEGPVPANDPGAAHATDIPFVFHAMGYMGNPVSESDTATANRMMDYWASFARDGDPNAPGLPAWPLYGGESPFSVMRFKNGGAAEPDPDRERMEFLDALNKAPLDQ